MDVVVADLITAIKLACLAVRKVIRFKFADSPSVFTRAQSLSTLLDLGTLCLCYSAYAGLPSLASNWLVN